MSQILSVEVQGANHLSESLARDRVHMILNLQSQLNEKPY